MYDKDNWKEAVDSIGMKEVFNELDGMDAILNRGKDTIEVDR